MKKFVLVIGILLSVVTISCEAQCCTDPVSSKITEEEKNSLRWMREEEKMAHDVYTAMADLYGMRFFENISGSEMRHTSAVRELLERYELEDPAKDKGVGEFSIPQIQSLYNDLLKKGSESYEAGIIVGLTIEDHDIAELDKALEEDIEAEDIRVVYENLLRGSKNHMKAFWFHAGRNDLEYHPQFITEEHFEQIISADNQASK